MRIARRRGVLACYKLNRSSGCERALAPYLTFADLGGQGSRLQEPPGPIWRSSSSARPGRTRPVGEQRTGRRLPCLASRPLAPGRATRDAAHRPGGDRSAHPRPGSRRRGPMTCGDLDLAPAADHEAILPEEISSMSDPEWLLDCRDGAAGAFRYAYAGTGLGFASSRSAPGRSTGAAALGRPGLLGSRHAAGRCRRNDQSGRLRPTAGARQTGRRGARRQLSVIGKRAGRHSGHHIQASRPRPRVAIADRAGRPDVARPRRPKSRPCQVDAAAARTPRVTDGDGRSGSQMRREPTLYHAPKRDTPHESPGCGASAVSPLDTAL